MRITFRRFPGHSSAYSVIERDDGVVYRMKEFTRAGTKLPHGAARALQVEAARWARLRVGEELVCEWLRAVPRPRSPARCAPCPGHGRPAIAATRVA